MRFKPKRPDGRSYRVVALDLLKDLQPGDVCTYQKLGQALALHPARQRSLIQQTVRMALRTLLKVYQRGVENIPNTGYRIIEAREHMIVADRHQSKAQRQMVSAIRFYDGTNLAEMTPVERKLHQGQQMLAHAVLASHRHLDKRIKKIEDLLGAADKTIEHDESEKQ